MHHVLLPLLCWMLEYGSQYRRFTAKAGTIYHVLLTLIYGMSESGNQYRRFTAKAGPIYHVLLTLIYGMSESGNQYMFTGKIRFIHHVPFNNATNINNMNNIQLKSDSHQLYYII
jgi:hypothetical protein